MATNTVVGILVCSDGTNIPLKAEIAEGTETTLTTDTTYTSAAINIGDYALGKTVTHGLIQFANGFQYAYILRQGVVQSVIACCVNGASTATPPAMGTCHFNGRRFASGYESDSCGPRGRPLLCD